MTIFQRCLCGLLLALFTPDLASACSDIGRVRDLPGVIRKDRVLVGQIQAGLRVSSAFEGRGSEHGLSDGLLGPITLRYLRSLCQDAGLDTAETPVLAAISLAKAFADLEEHAPDWEALVSDNPNDGRLTLSALQGLMIAGAMPAQSLDALREPVIASLSELISASPFETFEALIEAINTRLKFGSDPYPQTQDAVLVREVVAAGEVAVLNAKRAESLLPVELRSRLRPILEEASGRVAQSSEALEEHVASSVRIALTQEWEAHVGSVIDAIGEAQRRHQTQTDTAIGFDRPPDAKPSVDPVRSTLKKIQLPYHVERAFQEVLLETPLDFKSAQMDEAIRRVFEPIVQNEVTAALNDLREDLSRAITPAYVLTSEGLLRLLAHSGLGGRDIGEDMEAACEQSSSAKWTTA